MPNVTRNKAIASCLASVLLPGNHQAQRGLNKHCINLPFFRPELIRLQASAPTNEKRSILLWLAAESQN